MVYGGVPRCSQEICFLLQALFNIISITVACPTRRLRTPAKSFVITRSARRAERFFYSPSTSSILSRQSCSRTGQLSLFVALGNPLVTQKIRRMALGMQNPCWNWGGVFRARPPPPPTTEGSYYTMERGSCTKTPIKGSGALRRQKLGAPWVIVHVTRSLLAPIPRRALRLSTC